MTPIERAARALARLPQLRFVRDPENPSSEPAPSMIEWQPLAWEELTAETRESYLCHVRAVLTAIREPSTGMRTVGLERAEATAWANRFGDVEIRNDGEVQVWQAMIDAALEEG